MKVDILAIGVHPDDIELSCSGTLLKHMSLGYKVGLLDLTLGELGSRGNAETRTQEAREAAKIMGVEERIQLDLQDGFITANQKTTLEIIKAIRYFKPDIVLINAKSDRHPDHGRAAKITSEACFYSGLLKIETTRNGENQAHHRPKAVYHYIQDRMSTADFVVDVTDFVDKKMESILAYKTQFFSDQNGGPKTPISGADFLEYIKASMRIHGRAIGAEFAEGFQVERSIGVNNLLQIS